MFRIFRSILLKKAVSSSADQKTTTSAPPKSGLVQRDLVEAELRAVIIEFDQRAERMQERPAYWGLAVLLTQIAANASRRALAILFRPGVKAVNLELLVELLAVSSNYFFAEYGDDDFQGASCFLELARKAIDLQKFNNGNSVYSHDETWKSFGCYGRFSNSFIRYLNSPIELGRIAEALLLRDYAGCFEAARLIEDLTRRDDILRLVLRHQLMLSKRLGDEDAVGRISAQIAQRFQSDVNRVDDILDALTSGDVQSYAENGLTTVSQMRTDYWEGARRKSDGDPLGKELLLRSFLVDFDCDECVLAGADLGIPWHERMFASELHKASSLAV